MYMIMCGRVYICKCVCGYIHMNMYVYAHACYVCIGRYMIMFMIMGISLIVCMH